MSGRSWFLTSDLSQLNFFRNLRLFRSSIRLRISSCSFSSSLSCEFLSRVQILTVFHRLCTRDFCVKFHVVDRIGYHTCIIKSFSRWSWLLSLFFSFAQRPRDDAYTFWCCSLIFVTRRNVSRRDVLWTFQSNRNLRLQSWTVYQSIISLDDKLL